MFNAKELASVIDNNAVDIIVFSLNSRTLTVQQVRILKGNL